MVSLKRSMRMLFMGFSFQQQLTRINRNCEFRDLGIEEFRNRSILSYTIPISIVGVWIETTQVLPEPFYLLSAVSSYFINLIKLTLGDIFTV